MKHTTVRTVLAASLAFATTASADKADDLFKQAKKLMAEKKYADACPKFEASYKLDPGIGGEINIAHCYEEWGKLAKAYRAYLDAQKQAEDANDPRATKIRELAKALEPQVPRLMIHVPPGSNVKGLMIAIDGATIPTTNLDEPQLVDPGPKQIVYSIDGAPTKTKLVPVERGGSSELTLDLPRLKGDKPDPDGGHEVTKTHKKPKGDDGGNGGGGDQVAHGMPGHGQRIGGIVLGSVGIAAVGVSAVMAVSARSKYNDALSVHCMNMTNACDAQGLTATHDARSTANTATIIFGVGAAAVAAGVVVYMLAPHADPASEHAYYLAPTVTSDSAGFAFGGRL